jgi:hypothetical protein
MLHRRLFNHSYVKQLQVLQQWVLFVIPLSLFYSLLSVLSSTFCFLSFVFLFIDPCLLSNLLSSSFLLYFYMYLLFALWPVHVPIHPVIYFFIVLQFVLNVPAASSLYFSLSYLHYILFIIFIRLLFVLWYSLSFLLFLSSCTHLSHVSCCIYAWSIGSYIRLLLIQIYFW